MKLPVQAEAVENMGSRLLNLPPDALNRAVQLITELDRLPSYLAAAQRQINRRPR